MSSSRNLFFVILAIVLQLSIITTVMGFSIIPNANNLIIRKRTTTMLRTSTSSEITRDTQKEDEIERKNANIISTSARIAHSFQTNEFQPAWFARNNHFQTIMGTLYRQETMYFPTTKDSSIKNFEWDKRERMETPDGDVFDVNWKYYNTDTDTNDIPIVLICHGLESDSDSPLVKDMVNAFQSRVGMDAACINFRGCSRGDNSSPQRTPRAYHLGFTDDLFQTIQNIHEKCPTRRIYLSGFSLGANVVIKLLAQLGTDATDKYNIRGVAVNAIPYDLERAHVNLNSPGVTKSIYGSRLLQSMMDKTEEVYDDVKNFPFDKDEIRQCQTIMDFENLAIARVFNFDDAYDYYRKCQTKDVLCDVAVPGYAIQSLDDPFLLGQRNPKNANTNANEWPLRIQYTKNGGHCGHVFHSNKDTTSSSSWMPTQLARFLAHVEENII